LREKGGSEKKDNPEQLQTCKKRLVALVLEIKIGVRKREVPRQPTGYLVWKENAM